MPALLAQMNGPSAESIGLVVLILIFLSRWLWDYNRNRREEAAQLEPRAQPALHLTYTTKVEHSALAAKVDEELGRERGARKKIHEEISSLQSSVAAINTQNRNQTEALTEIKSEQQAIKREIKDDNSAMHTRIGEILTALGEIKGHISS